MEVAMTEVQDREVYYSLKTIEKLYDIPINTLRTWVRQRRIPYSKIGKLVRVRRSDIEAQFKPVEPFDVGAIVRDLRKGKR
jgi:excisionase family DNA binding protein